MLSFSISPMTLYFQDWFDEHAANYYYFSQPDKWFYVLGV